MPKYTTLELDAKAYEKKCQAIKNLNGLFNIPDGYGSALINTFVENILEASVLQAKSLIQEEMEEMESVKNGDTK